ncbi:hypothetical protein HS048_35485 [Planomonospora sp. ID91781]|uniref:hypothetical protein n=1 Tax=Planomonospora sp. ID91781 TaxID=2738135 RepID=UPI0018C37CBE|nr:hypothetical protein [Planomonospora sp. ID91781]MBG0825976.1 hypothetical protein [Planomonospora sp. ID91781]
MSRLRWLLTADRSPAGPPADFLASRWEPCTARTSHTAVLDSHNRDTVIHTRGIANMTDDLEIGVMTAGDETVRILRIGSEVYHRLPEAEQRETGRRWIWAESLPGYTHHEWGPASAMIQRSGQVRAFARENRDGEELRHYTFLLRPRHDEDPVAADLYQYLRLHGADRMTWEVWLTSDDHVRRVRSHVTTLRSRRALHGLVSMTSEYWDFDGPDGFAPPPPQDLLPRPSAG